MAENTLDPKAAKELNSIMTILSKEAEKLGIKQKDINKCLKEYNKQLDDAAGKYKTLGERIKESATFASGLVGANKILEWQGMVSEMVKTNSELHRSVINAGKGAEALNLYKSTAVQLSTELGATHEAANSIVKTLTDKQFLGTSDQISKAAKSTYALSRAFGINEKEVAENTVELQKWGQVSADTTTAMYADILKVAQANGLTKEGVQDVMKSTTKWSGILKAFGKAPEDVKKYNMSLARTVSALEKVGVSAKTTTGLLEELADPEKIEDNIPKYAALGISITDAITGNIDADKMGEGLKAFGEKLKQMGPIAGAQYAKTMGVSYKDAIKAASADMAEASQIEMTPEEKAYDQLTKMTEKTKDMTEQFKDIVNKAGGMIRRFGPALITIGATFLPAFLDDFKKKFTATVDDGTASGIENGTNKALKKAKKEIEDIAENAASKGFNLKDERNAQREAAKERKEIYLSMIKSGVTAEMAFQQQRENSEAKIDALKQEYNQKREKYDNNQAKLRQLEAGFDKAKSDKSRENIMAKIDALKEEQAKIIEDKKNINERKKTAVQELQNIKEEQQYLKNKLRDFKKGNAKAQAEVWADELVKKVSGTARSIAEKVSSPFKKVGGALAKAGKKAGRAISNSVVGDLARKAGALGRKIGAGIASKAKEIKVKLAGSPMASIGAKLGGLAIVATIIGKILSKLQAPLDLILDNLLKQLEPVFEALMPIIMLLGDLLGMLVKLLLPPILKILSFLLKAIGMLAGVFSKKVGDAIKESANKMSAAADKISNSDSNLSKSVDDNTEATKAKEKMTVSGGQVTVSKGSYEDSKSGNKEETTTNNSSSQTTSNSQVVNNVNATNKANEEMITYLKTLNEKFDTIISKLGNERGKEDEEMIKSSVQAGVVDAIRNNVVTVKPVDENFKGKDVREYFDL